MAREITRRANFVGAGTPPYSRKRVEARRHGCINGAREASIAAYRLVCFLKFVLPRSRYHTGDSSRQQGEAAQNEYCYEQCFSDDDRNGCATDIEYAAQRGLHTDCRDCGQQEPSRSKTGKILQHVGN